MHLHTDIADKRQKSSSNQFWPTILQYLRCIYDAKILSQNVQFYIKSELYTKDYFVILQWDLYLEIVHFGTSESKSPILDVQLE